MNRHYPILVYEPHSTSVDNERGVASGLNDSPLSEAGVRQAREIGARYKNFNDIQAIYTSDLQRSQSTAEHAFHGRTLPVYSDVRLREWNYGDFNGMSSSLVEELKKDHIDTPFPQGESFKQVVERISNWIDDLLYNYSCGTIIIIGHRSLYYALEVRYKKKTAEQLLQEKWVWQPGWRY